MVSLGLGKLSDSISRRFRGVAEGDTVKGVGIVALTGVLAGATSYVISGRVQLPAEVSGMLGTVRTVSLVTGLLSTLVGYAASVAIYHGFCHLLGGAGSLKRMFALGGYASLPMLAQHALRLGYYLVVNDPSDLVPAADGGIVRTILGVFNFFTVAALILTSLALRENYKVKTLKGLAVAVVPMLITLGLAVLLQSMASAQRLTLRGEIFIP